MRQIAGAIGRHDVGDVAQDENFARMRIKDHFRRDAGVAAADHHHGGALSGCGKAFKPTALQRQTCFEERQIAF